MSVSSSFYSVYTETESGEITPQSHIPNKWQSQGLKLNLSDCITPRQEKEDPHQKLNAKTVVPREKQALYLKEFIVYKKKKKN